MIASATTAVARGGGIASWRSRLRICCGELRTHRLVVSGALQYPLMPSRALVRWRTDQKAKLDELEAVHRAVGGTGPGRRYLTQLNHAYLVMLAAQWQDFCR